MVHWRVLSSMWSFHKAGVIFSLQTLGTSKALMRTVNHWGICNNCNKSCCPLAIKHTSGNACFFSKGTAINPSKKWWIFKFAMLVYWTVDAMTRLGWCLRFSIRPRSPMYNHIHMDLVNQTHQPPMDGL